MPNISDRSGKEEEWARIIGRLLARQLGATLEEIVINDDAIDISGLTPEWWQAQGADFLRGLSPNLRGLFLEQAATMLDDVGVAVEWAQVNRQAIDWVQSYGFELVKGMNDTRRATLQTLVQQQFGTPTTLGELRTLLAPEYGPVRASMIATTEITRAAAQGESAFVRGLQDEGTFLRAVYQTRNDGHVSDICLGLHDVRAENPGPDPVFIHRTTGQRYGLPPNHMGCRSWPNWERA